MTSEDVDDFASPPIGYFFGQSGNCSSHVSDIPNLAGVRNFLDIQNRHFLKHVISQTFTGTKYRSSLDDSSH